MFYVKGVASTRLIDITKQRTPNGRFYMCPTPDGYSGIVLAGEVESYAYSAKPFTIFGVSPASQGMAYLASDEEAKKRSEAFYSTVAEVAMHPKLASQPYSPLITLMTADYLLTVQDLPGWPGKIPSIDYRKLLIKGLNELAHGLYREDRLARELKILHKIAEYHGLGSFFQGKVRAARRYQKKEMFSGSGIGPGVLMLDGKQYAIRTILDAAFVAHYLFQITASTTLGSVTKAIWDSLKYRFRSARKGGPFPLEVGLNP
jgi:hypothetical protein